ncbi:hypothetical protein AY599_26200 [Leptolyngbya valderiana BDU 20041]|nr:hypothetical protein AY599_26200 [Leptolyngbya valderiana BDU 20041]
MTKSRLIILLGLVIGLAAVAADYFELRRFNAVAEQDAVVSPLGPGLYDTFSIHPAARQAARNWAVDPDHAAELLAEAADLYPLEALPWLAQARIKAGRDGDPAVLKADLLAGVAVQPGSSTTRWQAAQIALHAGDLDLAEQLLRLWAEGQARDLGQALFIAGRWIRDPDELLDRIVPPTQAHWESAMDFAYRQRNRDLAEAVWARLASSQALDSPLFLTYFEFLLREGEVDEAMALWQRSDARYRPGTVLNGGFDQDFGPARGLNWRVDRLPEGVRIDRDLETFVEAPASLRVDFAGSHNLRLAHPSIQVPLVEGRRFRLTGYWRGQGLTTRARPYLFVRAVDGAMNRRLDVPGAQFGWQEFSVDLDLPEGARLIEISLRRDSTQAFDRYIGGTLWLDEIEIEPLPGIDDPAPPLAAE